MGCKAFDRFDEPGDALWHRGNRKLRSVHERAYISYSESHTQRLVRIGTGNDYQKWDFTLAYTLELGPVFFTPGYNFRYQPGVVGHGHSESEQEETSEEHAHHEGHGHDAHGEADEHHVHGQAGAEHSHGTYGNEIFFMLGTTAIPYVSPSMFFVCDLNNTPGSYLEIRLDGDIPLYRNVFKLQPYTLLSLNLGYNTTTYYGWNNFQFGLT